MQILVGPSHTGHGQLLLHLRDLEYPNGSSLHWVVADGYSAMFVFFSEKSTTPPHFSRIHYIQAHIWTIFCGLHMSLELTMLSEACWMDTKDEAVLSQWEDPISEFAVEEAKIKFNANRAIQEFGRK